ncbi:Chitin synthase D [Cyphellophora attinorum]|uniref:chitin synthase n=1 Tax=Cyphellophora attinorum TaxID=1664694 RepID=A0A0N1HY48_9EURO|nr:Chitin synthase D [Phialophora attinorum]KPI43174.1 Chitin synthase D [Phialophora attinorum]
MDADATQHEDAVPAKWSNKDIIYVACVSPVLLAAFLEWFLWLAAFFYCLYKAFRKADHWSQRLLATLLFFIFLIIRGIFLPVMIVTIPLPNRITRYFPDIAVDALQEFAFYAFAVLLTIPWLVVVYQIIVHPIGRRKLVKYTLDEHNAPKVVVVMPVYKEPPDSLWKALNSVVDGDYPPACIHVFLSFDGEEIDELYLRTIDRLGIPVTMKEFPKSIDVAYNGSRVTISRFRHGGKRHCQKATYMLIDKIYRQYLAEKDDLFILFIDSDCILDSVCIQNFMYEMELKPGNTRDMLAMTGVITSSTGRMTLLTLLQDMEYVHGQLYERSVESGLGAVTCLPGALTMLRLSAFRNMAKFYFSDKAENCEDLFDYGKTHLGEDRWLTHLFMLGAQKRYQIQMCSSAFCKTEAVQTFGALLKQRRRWFLGFITNEVCMLTDYRLWRKYTFLCLIRLMQDTIRTTALLFTIMMISVATKANQFGDLPWQFICVSLGLNWLMMLYFAARLTRLKAALYPMMFVLNPFMNWVYMIYGIFTAGQRTWGGPRADAGAADAKVTPQQAIEHAMATGDDLNVVPETFKSALGARQRRLKHTTLQPSPSVEGRFAPAVLSPTPSHHARQESGQSDVDMKELMGNRDMSGDLSDSEGISIHTPRHVPTNLHMTEAMYGVEGMDVADPNELSRRLNIISGETSMIGRSPLAGRAR